MDSRSKRSAAALAPVPSARGAGACAGGRRREAQHPGDLGRRHRPVQRQRLQQRHDGLPHAQHRPDRRGGRALHRLVRPAELHRRARRLHHRPVADPHRPDQGRPARRARGHEGRGPDHRRAAASPLGYVTGQFGKNHLGDRDEMLPTNNGFEQFFGNLYHLNAEEEPENPDYPTDPAFKEQFGPRGVIRSSANADGTQTIEDTGPLTRKRMETVDEEVTAEALAFMDKAHADGKPFFVWWNSTRMHVFTHLKPESEGVTGLGDLRRRHGRARRPGRPAARQARRARHRRQHHRDVLDRQRRRDLHLARRRHHDVPRREEHQLGGRLPRADASSAGRASSSPAPSSTTSPPTRTC